jgi:hypothetical protein
MVEIDELEAALSSEVIDLAASLSIAAEVDPALLRRMRRLLHPRLDHESEAVLYHSELAASQGRHGFVLNEHLLPDLRFRLVDDNRLDAARQVIAASHKAWPALIRLDEELTYELLSKRDPDGVRRLIGSVVALLRDSEDRRPVSRWILRAFRRAPEQLFDDDRFATQAFSLVQAASAVLGGALFGRSLAASDDVQRLPVLTDRVMAVGVRLAAEGLVFTGTAASRNELRVPAAWPVVLGVEGADGPPTTLTLHDPASVVAARLQPPAVVTTITGQRTRIEQAPHLAIAQGSPLDSVAWASVLGVFIASARGRWARQFSPEIGAQLREIPLGAGSVSLVTVAASGGFAAYVDDEQHAVVWRDLLEDTPPRVERTTGTVQSLTLSGTGRDLAVADRESVTIHHVSEQSQQPIRAALSHVVISPDGRWLAGRSDDRGGGTIDVWHGEPARLLHSFELEAPATAATWTWDETRFAVGTETGLLLLDAEMGTVVGHLSSSLSTIRALACSQDGKLLAGGDAQGRIEIWDFDVQQQPAQRLTARGGGINSLAWAPDGSQLASGTDDGMLRIWDVLVPTRTEAATTPSTSLPAMQLTVIPAADGTALVLELGRSGDPFRMVIDGGPSRSYRSGLGAFFAARDPSDRFIDILAATHTDSAAIDGVIQLLGDSELNVSIGEIWHNGLRQVPREQSL